jgi:hypothetical protein
MFQTRQRARFVQLPDRIPVAMPADRQCKQLTCLATLFDSLSTDAEDLTDLFSTESPAVFLNQFAFGFVSSNECRSEWLDCF